MTTMGNVKVGDTLFGMDGRQVKVLAVSDVMRGRKCLEVEFSGGEKIVCDAKHEWIVGDDGHNMRASEIMASGVEHPVPDSPPLDIDVSRLLPDRRVQYNQRITAIKETDTVPVKCVQVEGGTYLCSRAMLPTHNSAMLANMVVPYLIHRWIKLQRPAETLDILRSTPLVGTLCAQTFAKAQELLFQPLLDTLQSAPWFQEYHALLAHYQETLGHPLYKIGPNAIRYFHRGLMFYPSGPNKRTLRGPTRIFSALDELGWFAQGEEKENLEKASANEVYASLDRSLKTVRMASKKLILEGKDNMPMAFACNISSPSSYWDKMMTLVRTHQGSADVLTAHLATWDFNPTYRKSDFEKEYRDDRVKADRDFGANPPMAETPWISDMSNVLRNLGNKKQKAAYRYSHRKSQMGQRQRYAEMIAAPKSGVFPKSVMGVDAGYSNNSFAVAIASPILNMKDDYDELDEYGFTITGANVSFLGEVAPDRTSGAVVNHTLLTKHLLYPLIDTFNVGLVVADRWQSLKMLTDIEEDFGISALQFTLKGDDFNRVLDFLNDEDSDGVKLPAMEMGLR